MSRARPGPLPDGPVGPSARTAETRRRPDAAPPRRDAAEEHAFTLAAGLAGALRRSWERGEPLAAEAVLGLAGGALFPYPAAALLVVLEEVRLRAEAGRPPPLDELVERFPAWQHELRHRLTAEPAEPRYPECGDVLHGFRLLAELGRGGQGCVFLALDGCLADRPVVLKVSPRHSEEHLALARLQHTHIVPLLTALDLPAERWRVLCMPYLGGAPLSAVLDALLPAPRRDGRTLLEALDRLQADAPVAAHRDGPARRLLSGLSHADAVAWMGACLAEALHFAHERGLVHLDLKPSNVLLAADGLPLLLDFHLARPPLAAGAAAPGWFGGTPGYMAPEHEAALAACREGRPLPSSVDGRADVYGLGVILYEALSGRLPAPGRPGPLHRVNPEVSRGLSDVLDKCLEPEPGRRYARAGDLADDLRRYLNRTPLRGVPNRSWSERWRNWRGRHPASLAWLGLLVLLTAALAAGLLGSWFTADGRRREGAAALAEGRGLLAAGKPEEAERSFERGLGRARGVPLTADLCRDLEAGRSRAHDLRVARSVRALADDLRFRVEPEALAPDEARRLDELCRAAWRRGPGDGADEAVRADLLDLAILSADLHVRAAAGGDERAARREAVRLLAEAEERCGAGPATAAERARHLRALDDPAAKEAEAEAARQAPRTAWEFAALGRSALRDGRLDEAAAALAEAVRRQPQGLWPNFYRGVCAYRRGRADEAVEAFTVCVALAPDRATCYYNRARALTALRRLDDAARDLDRCLELDAALADAWLARGVLRYEAGRLDDALADLAEARSRGADPAAVAYNRALVHHARKDRAATLADLDECLRHRPDHAAARALRARLGP
jgi:eukaryotic-like serine/threonine-protein kinase